MMAMLVLAIIPIVIFFVTRQKYIIEGVVAGAVKVNIKKGCDNMRGSGILLPIASLPSNYGIDHFQ